MFIFSNSLTELLEELCQEMDRLDSSQLVIATIVVPNESIRAYLKSALAQKNHSLLRLEIVVSKGCLSIDAALWTLLITQFFSVHANTLGVLDPYAQARAWRIPLLSFLTTGETRHANLPHQFLEWCEAKIRPTSLHAKGTVVAFGFSSLSPGLLRQFLDARVKKFFVLSPCMLFWSDHASTMEAYHLLGQYRQLASKGAIFQKIEDLILDRQELLANCGTVGREFLDLIIDLEGDIESRYVLSEALHCSPYTDHLSHRATPKAGPPTLLEYVRADMLLLPSKTSEKRTAPTDRSIEIHAGPTRLQEVYALRRRIEALPPLTPASVIILCTELSLYRSAIETVFGGDSWYQVWGEPKRGGALETFDSLLNLCTSSSTSFDWKQLVRQPAVQRGLSLDNNETSELLNYLTSIPTVWGLSRTYQERYLDQRCLPHPSKPEISFTEEKERFIASFLDPSNLKSPIPSCASLFLALEKIDHSFPLPLDENASYTVGDLLPFLQTLLEVFFKGDEAEEKACIRAVALLATTVQEIGDPKLPLYEIRKILRSLTKKELLHKEIALRAPIIVAELSSFQPFPATLIALLGAGEEWLPKADDDLLVEKMHLLTGKAARSNIFLDKYALIEILLSAENLFIGYPNYSFQTKEPLLPSPIVTSLLHHLDTSFTAGTTPLSEQICHSSTLQDRMTASQKSLPPLPPHRLPPPKEPATLEIDRLFLGSRSPLQRYYEAQFSLKAPYTKEETIFVSPYVVQRHMTKSQDPSLVPEAISVRIDRAQQNLHDCLDAIGMKSISFIDINLLPHTTIESPCIRGISLYGTLKNASLEGIILTTTAWRKELFKRWCEHAVRCHLSHIVPFESSAIIVNSKCKISLPMSTSLETWIDLYQESTRQILPLTYEIASLLVQEASCQEVLEAIIAHGETFSPPHPWSLFANSVTHAQVEAMYNTLKQYALTLFQDLFSIPEPS